MKKLCIGFAMLVLLTGCQNIENAVPNHTTAPNQVKGKLIHPISIGEEAEVEVIGWFDEESLLYLTAEEKSFEIYIHNVFTGEEELFYADDQSFYRLDSSQNLDYFALQTINADAQVELSILDPSGSIALEPELDGDEYSIFWSPYEESELMVVTFLPDWQQEVYHVFIEDEDIQQTAIQSSYFQWNSSGSIVYLDWSLIPSIEAPLSQYHIGTSTISEWYGSGLFFSSLYRNRSLVVTYNEVHSNEISYQFLGGQEEELASITIPVLNTFSEQWWITSFAFDGESDIFYYLRPYHSADFVSYKDGFELFAYDLTEQSHHKLGELDSQQPLTISLDGQWLLTGSKNQRLINTEDASVYTLF